MDARRVAFRLTEIFDYRTFAVAGVFGTLVIVGFLVFSSAQTAHDALKTQQSSGARASRRIDGLQRVIAGQAQRISDVVADNAKLRAGQEALAEQVKQMGGRPVVSASPGTRVYVVSSPPADPKASASPEPSAAPRPTPSKTREPSPSPSPTCRPLPIFGCVGR